MNITLKEITNKDLFSAYKMHFKGFLPTFLKYKDWFNNPIWTYYYDAVCAYIEYVGEEMSVYYDGSSVLPPTDEPQAVDSMATDNEDESTNKLIYIGGSVLLGVLAAFIFVKSVKSKHKTVNKKSSANDYVIPGSLNITQSYEAFLYKNVTKTEKQQNNNQQAKK